MNIDRKISTAIAFLIIFLVIAPAAWATYRSWLDLVEATTYQNPISIRISDKDQVSAEEIRKINSWIAAENLNEYGDPAGTFYIGGTPLFDESTGQTIDKYEYIISKHPDKPWNKS